MRFMKRMLSVILSSAMAASVCCAGMSTVAADGNDVAPRVALWEENGLDTPDWVPQDFESAFDFTNDHGFTLVYGNLFCIVTKVAGSAEKSYVKAGITEDFGSATLVSNRNYSYDLGQTTTTTNIFGDGHRLPDYYYNVMVFEFGCDTDAEINVSVYEKGDESVVKASEKFSLTMSRGTLTENGFSGWLPDSIGEFNRFRDEHGEVSIVNGYLVYCGNVLYAGGFDLYVSQSEPERLECVYNGGVKERYIDDMIPVGGPDHIIKVYKPVSEGDVDISFCESRNPSNLKDAEVKHLTIDSDMTIVDRDIEYPEWVPVDFESTMEFLRKHGKTWGADGLICTVRIAYSRDSLPEEWAECRNISDRETFSRDKFLISERTFEFVLPEKPDKSDSLAYSDYIDWLYSLGLTESLADNGEIVPVVYKVSIYKALPDSFTEISHYSCDGDQQLNDLIDQFLFTTKKDENDNIIISETDIYGWLPDSEEEYNEYVKENGSVSVHDKYIVYCGMVGCCAGYGVFADTKGVAKIKKSAEYEIYVPDLSILDGGSSPMVVLFEGTRAGKAQVDFYTAFKFGGTKKYKEITKYIKIGSRKIPELIDEKDMPEKLAGDCNYDGVIGISDVITLQYWLIGSGDMEAPENADVNGDGSVDVFDIVALRKLVVSETNEFTMIVRDPKPVIAVVQQDYAWGSGQKITAVDENGRIYTGNCEKWIDAKNTDDFYSEMCSFVNEGNAKDIWMSDSLVAETRMLSMDISSNKDDAMGKEYPHWLDAPYITYYLFGKDAGGSITALPILTTRCTESWIDCAEIQEYIREMALEGNILTEQDISLLLGISAQ